MAHIDLKVLLLAVAGFLLLGFASKIVLLAPIGNIFLALFGPSTDPIAMVIGLCIGNILSGYVVGAYTVRNASALPLYHGLVLAILVGAYRLARGELQPMSGVQVVTVAFVAFTAVMCGAWFSRRRNAV